MRTSVRSRGSAHGSLYESSHVEEHTNDEGYRTIPEEPHELGEVDSLNPYAEQTTAPDLVRQRTWSGYFPILSWLPTYSLVKLRGDMISGLSTGAMIIPQALAYRFSSTHAFVILRNTHKRCTRSLLAGLPPTMGLYTGFFALLVYSVLGQCGQLSIGPDAMTAMLVRSFLLSFATDKDLDGLDAVVSGI